MLCYNSFDLQHTTRLNKETLWLGSWLTVLLGGITCIGAEGGRGRPHYSHVAFALYSMSVWSTDQAK